MVDSASILWLQFVSELTLEPRSEPTPETGIDPLQENINECMYIIQVF